MRSLLSFLLSGRFAAAFIILFLINTHASAQVFVYPRRPHQSQVRYYEFDWRYIDILVGSDAGPETREKGPRGPYDNLRFSRGLDDGTMPAGEYFMDYSPERIYSEWAVSGGGRGVSSWIQNWSPGLQLPLITGKSGDYHASLAGEKADGREPEGEDIEKKSEDESETENSGPEEEKDSIEDDDAEKAREAEKDLDHESMAVDEVLDDNEGQDEESEEEREKEDLAKEDEASVENGVIEDDSSDDPGEDCVKEKEKDEDKAVQDEKNGVENLYEKVRKLEDELLPVRIKDSMTERELPAYSGGVRLFFYGDASDSAEKAAAVIKAQYLYLVEIFDYVPTRTFPYILYGTYQEFLQTNLFPLQEGVLGVTSPKDLKLSLPYFGDHRLFGEISLHELVHQFTIQKIRTFSEKAGVWGDPLESVPLWFIEGIAEFYAKGGVDHETEMLVRDIVVNPDYRRGYLMLDFHDDRPWSALWTYRVGQARVAFLEEIYGKGTIQEIIEKSPMLAGSVREKARMRNFTELLEKITGDSSELISKRFEDWIKRRSFESYMDASQTAQHLEYMKNSRGRINALAASPDGNLLAYRSMDMETGRTRIFLKDIRDEKSTKSLAGDAVPGVESLHPIQARNFDLSAEEVVFIAQAGGRDIIYVQPWESRVRKSGRSDRDKKEKKEKKGSEEAGAKDGVDSSRERGSDDEQGPVLDNEEIWDVRISLGRRKSYDLYTEGILAAFSPAFEPDGKRIAFVGLNEKGLKNVYVLSTGTSKGNFSINKITDDENAPRQLSWGAEGIVFNSDATAEGKYNLFIIDPDNGDLRRLTYDDERDHFDPRYLPCGKIMYSAFVGGRADVHEIVNGKVIRRTDIDTGLFDVSPGPDGGIWALFHRSGRRIPVFISKDKFISDKQHHFSSDTVRLIPSLSLPDEYRYNPLSPSNWEMGNLFGFFGAGAGGLFGQIMATASDRLRDHVLVLNLFVFGSLELTDGYLLYINQQRRITWGAGPFQSLRFRRDRTFDLPDLNFTSGERFFGGMFSLRYPFNRFLYIQGDFSIGGVDYFISEQAGNMLEERESNGSDLLTEWNREHGAMRFQTEATGRIGYDTIRYHPGTGPLAGSSAMLEGTFSLQPLDDEIFGNVRLDLERYIPIWGRTHVFFRGGAGASFGGRFTRQFFLSSWDTIRGVEFGHDTWLLGSHFFFSTAELQVPLNSIIRVLIFSDIEGIVGLDFGGVSDDLSEILDKRVFNVVTGFNFGLGPLVFRLHFARPFDTGAPEGVPGQDGGEWVTNFSLGWLYY